MSFAQLKAQQANVAQLQQQVQQSGKKPADPRMFKHSFDKDSLVGSTLIRFLPRYDAEGKVIVPWAHWTEYSFKSTTGNYWNRALSNIGKDDPVSELNNAHWATITDKKGADAAEARKRNVKKKYIANIAVMNDPVNPENNGKVFLYEFGPSIQKLLEKAWFPVHADKTPLTFFDWDQGANFRIRSFKDDKSWMCYDDSEFEAITPLAGGDQAKQEIIYTQMHDLSEFEAESNYKEYDALKIEMTKVLGARYVARIMGEEYKPEQAAEAQSNPFEKDTSQSAQQQSAQVNTVTDSSKDDPFAKASSTGGEQTDPFAGATTPAQTDPFAGAQSSGEDSADPFANINANG